MSDNGMYWWEIWGKQPGSDYELELLAMPDPDDWFEPYLPTPEQCVDQWIEQHKDEYAELRKQKVWIQHGTKQCLCPYHRRFLMALLPKTAAAAGPATAGAPSKTVIVAVIMFLLHVIGPAALPIIENWLAGLNLPPALLAEIDAILESILKAQPATP